MGLITDAIREYIGSPVGPLRNHPFLIGLLNARKKKKERERKGGGAPGARQYQRDDDGKFAGFGTSRRQRYVSRRKAMGLDVHDWLPTGSPLVDVPYAVGRAGAKTVGYLGRKAYDTLDKVESVVAPTTNKLRHKLWGRVSRTFQRDNRGRFAGFDGASRRRRYEASMASRRKKTRRGRYLASLGTT